MFSPSDANQTLLQETQKYFVKISVFDEKIDVLENEMDQMFVEKSKLLKIFKKNMAILKQNKIPVPLGKNFHLIYIFAIHWNLHFPDLQIMYQNFGNSTTHLM